MSEVSSTKSNHTNITTDHTVHIPNLISQRPMTKDSNDIIDSRNAYYYDEKDNLRNNRPKWPITIKFHNSHGIRDDSANNAQNPVVFPQTPRLHSSLDDFEVISTIGTGSYGTCKKIRRKRDGKLMVWKEMDYGSMTESEKHMLVSEVNLLRELRHQHIVKYYDRIIDRNKTTIYIIMEYCQGGDLATIISRNRKDGSHVDEDFAWKILIQITLALKECHRRKNGKAVLHRDLKPANVFLDAESSVKLGDFGLARVLHHDSSLAQTYVGTPYYMSPELVNNMSYNEKSDIWALGCILYELCALSPPFVASTQSELNRKIRIGEFPRLPERYYSTELDFVIRKMIQVEVTKRPSIDAILADTIVQRKMQSVLGKGAILKSQVTKPPCQSLSNKGTVESRSEELKTKMKQLELKEKELESRERSVALREKLAEEKMKRAMELYQKYKQQVDTPTMTHQSSSAFTRYQSADDSLLSSHHSCLSKGSRDPDIPKKRVTFDDYLIGKENLRQKSSYKGFIFNAISGLYEKEENFTRDLITREDSTDRYFDRVCTAGIRGYDRERSFTSRNLLYNFR